MNIEINHLNSIFGSEYLITLLSNASAYLYEQIEDINWCGFYILEGDKLVLGPFQGKPACEIITLNRGVCGYCATKKETIVVSNVHEFPGHIACDSESNSEIVLPIFKDNALFGLLDIDSKLFARFGEEEKQILENVVKELEKQIEKAKHLEGKM